MATCGKAGLLLLLLVAVFFTTVTPAMAQQTDLDFDDPLTGPSSPHLSNLFIGTKYSYTSGGLTRTQSDSGTQNGTDRPMVKTLSGAFLTTDFVYDVDVTSPPGIGDIIFVGFGEGLANPNFFDEPTNSFLFRIHNLNGFNRVDAAVEVGQVSNPFTYLETISGTWPIGTTTTFRITAAATR